jgi:hypothetical protein
VYLNLLATYSFQTQLTILKASSADTRIASHRQRLIDNAINTLDEHSALQSTIREQLTTMRFNSDTKRVAILSALEDIRKTLNGGAFDEAIKNDLRNPQSVLYKAYNLRRYTPFFPLTSETGSLQKIKIQAGITSPNEGSTTNRESVTLRGYHGL